LINQRLKNKFWLFYL